MKSFNEFIFDWFNDKVFAKKIIEHKDEFLNIIYSLACAYRFYKASYDYNEYVWNTLL